MKNINVTETSFAGMFTKIREEATWPTLGTEFAGAFDLYATEGQPLRRDAEEASLFRTGIGLIIPQGHHVQFWPRSSKGKQRILIHGGFIDYDFRRELVVMLSYIGPNYLYISPGEKIAQMSFVACLMPGVPSLDRGPGFGSTDK
ncbi:MAG: hypothetical protein KGI50_06905 [Patescibacteria group bacterium]|nr:hypothetical protein [Patescibacteria group bacterium]MDE2438819.1 hypothetical protein [Patescibacteria group bacterium]